MIALEILVNGKRVSLIGSTDPGFVYASVGRGRKRHERKIKMEITTGGANFLPDDVIEHLAWATQNLSVGDEVTFRFVEVETADVPKRIDRTDPAAREKMGRESYEYLKAQFGGDSVTE